ncbi:MAG: hypothetical protein JNL18_25180 [Planctomycetaceae bacterium]|nr:hypothetical protein [Planctomycetaceae bacterium]
MYKLMMSQRMTSLLSALVALGILGLGVTARPTADPTRDRTDALEADLRFQIEMSWRHDGRTRAMREEELDRTLAAWEASPQTGPDRQLLEKWLRGAIVGTLPGESGKFPPTPTFSELPVEPAKPAAAANPAAKLETQPPAPTPAGELAEAAQPMTALEPKVAAPPAASPRDVELKPGQAYTPPKAKEFRITPRAPRSEQAARRVETTPAEMSPAPPTSAPHQEAAAPPQRVIAAKPVEVPPQSPPSQAETVEGAAQGMNQSADVSPPKSTPPEKKPTAAPVVVAPPTRPTNQTTPEAAPPAKPMAKVAPPAGDVEATPTTVVAEHDAPTPPVLGTPAPPVMVNLVELNAQIRGYHEGLDEIDAQVIAKPGQLTEGEVALLVGKLEQLAAQHEFVRLYYDGLSKSERRFVAAPRSMAESIALVEKQRAALAAEEEDFLTALEGAVAADELAERLKTLAAEAQAGD